MVLWKASLQLLIHIHCLSPLCVDLNGSLTFPVSLLAYANIYICIISIRFVHLPSRFTSVVQGL